jgi:hypothetical protein
VKQRTQVKVVTTVEQAEAVERVARERGISKQALLRDAIAAATGTPNDFRPYSGTAANGFATYNERRRKQSEEAGN